MLKSNEGIDAHERLGWICFKKRKYFTDNPLTKQCEVILPGFQLLIY